MGFCGSTFKFLVFLFNFIFFLAGVAIIGLGSYMAIKMKDYFDFLSTSELAPGVGVSSYIFIVVGVLVTIVSFLGCCAACTDNKCMMGSFAALMAVILIAEVGVAVTILMYKDKAKDVVSDAMIKGMENYGKTESGGVTKTWDEIQETFTCCGVTFPGDWANATSFQGGDKDKAPDSCCDIKTPGCGANKLVNPYTGLHQKGCLAEFYGFVKGNAFLVGGVGIGIIVVQLIAVIAGCCLAKKMGDKENYV